MMIVVKFYYDPDIPYDIPIDICVYGASHIYKHGNRHRWVELREFHHPHFYAGDADSPYYAAAETLVLHGMYSWLKWIE